MSEHTAENDAHPCADCEHTHTPDGCVGPPSPSDLWAGVSPATCDCDAPIPPASTAPHTGECPDPCEHDRE